MLTRTEVAESHESLDPAATALWSAHPEGPPAEIYEPPFDEIKAVARALALEAIGMQRAVATFPRLFGPEQRRRACG
ncbi:hypothetical protein IWQ49_000051 [Labrenzia sp. EL_126]|nr:hypothetical protein [Labrenzia sp. EL_126]